MIYVIPELRLNDFKECYVAKPKDIFSRIGKRQSPTSFESSDETVLMNMNKIDSLAYMDDYDAYMQSQIDTSAQQGGTDTSSPGDEQSQTDDQS